MPDFSMCSNGGKCKKKETCKRRTSKASNIQSWGRFCNSIKGKECIFYINEQKQPEQEN